MTKEYFESHVLKCRKCGCIPRIVVEKDIIPNTDIRGYRIICLECNWADGDFSDNKTGLCKTPENALKAWNKKMRENRTR